MPITRLNTFEGVPIGKENFEKYTEYLSTLVARSNPFIETDSSDFNDIIALGSGQEVILASDYPELNTLTLNSLNQTTSVFAYRFPNISYDPYVTSINNIDSTTTSSVTPGSITTGSYIIRVLVEPTTEFSTTTGNFNILLNGSPVSDTYEVSAANLSEDAFGYFYINTALSPGDLVSLNFTKTSGSGGLDFSFFIYNYEDWSVDSTYLINYRMFGPIVSRGLRGRVNVYYGSESDSIESTDTSLVLIDSVNITPNNDSLGSLLFRPESTDSQGSLIFMFDTDEDSDISVPVEIDTYKLTNGNLITVSGGSTNSFAFLSNDAKELFSVQTEKLADSYSTPGVRLWQIPMASVSELFFSPEDIGYGFVPELLPDTYSRFSSGNYTAAKSDTSIGGYSKGFILSTINGIPQVHDNQVGTSGFFQEDKLEASDVYQLKSLRLGSEYPTPKYTLPVNHQYAAETIQGFSSINSTSTTGLGSEDFQNTLFFPFTDFLINPTLLLIHKNPEGIERYYYIPQDTEFSGVGEVKANHYKVIDPGSGEVRFNFKLGIPSGGLNRFWIVSAEQLTESTTNNVTDYFSSYGRLYSPTANLNVSTKVLSFDPTLLIDTDLEFTLPEIPLIPSTRIISSGGGPIISDAEDEFSRFTLYAISYPGRIDADEFIRLQANKYEPDVFSFVYYCGGVSGLAHPSPTPHPTYVKLVNNDISWYNRGINRLTYDPVTRATFTSICLAVSETQRPVDGSRLDDLKRRSTLSALVSTISAEDTNFMSGQPTQDSFLFGNSSSQIASTTATPGSLLVGRSGGSPIRLDKGDDGQVLTATSTSVVWDRVRVPAISKVTVDGSTINSTDGTILKFDYEPSQIGITLDSIVTATDATTVVGISLASDVEINNLTVSGDVSLPVTGVDAGSYGTITSIPRITIADDGRISSASDIQIDTNAWKFITDGTSTLTASSEDTLSVVGSTNQVSVSATSVSGSDVLQIALTTDVSIAGRLTAGVLRVPHLPSAPVSAINGDLWTTSTGAFVRISSTDRELALTGGHVHTASDISSGVLTVSVGGTGHSGYTNGQILIGNSSGGLSKATISVDSNLSIINGSGFITLNVNSASQNVVDRIVRRDSSGNFSAGTITANLVGNASTAASLQTARTINGVSFDGTSNITITSASPASLSAGFGLTGTSFNGSTARVFAVSTDEIVTRKTAQEITGAKTFTSTITGNISGQAGSVVGGVYITGNQTIDGVKTFTSTIQGSISGNSATVTDGVYLSTPQTITGTKTFSNVLITKTSNATSASVRIPHGSTPSAPVSGDMWSTTSGLLFRVGSDTKSVLFTQDANALYAPIVHTHNLSEVTLPPTPLPIANGGTAASTAPGARANLGLGTAATMGTTASRTLNSTNTVLQARSMFDHISSADHDGRYVRLDTPQTISGIKTFNSTIQGSIQGSLIRANSTLIVPIK